MKYRIVEYTNDDAKKFYVVQFQFSWMWIKFWRTLTQGTSSKSMYERPRTFDTLEEAQLYVRGTTCQTRVVEEGEV